MNFTRFLLSTLALALSSLTLTAQAPAAPAAVAETKAVKLLPIGRVAWINSNAFVEEGAGIKALVRVIKELELEFSGTQSELSLQSEKLRTLVGELSKLQAGGEANAAAIQQKQAEGMKLQRELQAKQQQAQAAITQAQQEKQGPVANDIGKALGDFAKEREIGLLVDIAKLGDGILFAQPELDVTAEFIAYYNASH